MPTPSPAAGPARHALIIEDDLVSGLGLQAMLQALGFGSFAFASTPEQAREQARLRTPDLATVDMGLLDGDGSQAVLALREVSLHVPTLLVTGDPDQASQALPGVVVLAKPVTSLDLRRALATLRLS